jgi:hypothetical protein
MEHHRLNKHPNTFTCGVCQKRFTRKDNLDRHERKHNNGSFFPYNECELLYRRKDNLYHHLDEKHQSGVGLQNQPVDISITPFTKEKGKKIPRFNTESNEYTMN